MSRVPRLIAFLIAMLSAAPALASGQGGQFIGVDDDP
jgi:hypothetical protein